MATSDLLGEDECHCGEPESAPHHTIGGCRCRMDSHVFGCHYLRWMQSLCEFCGEPAPEDQWHPKWTDDGAPMRACDDCMLPDDAPAGLQRSNHQPAGGDE